jgi:hypothetical protein
MKIFKSIALAFCICLVLIGNAFAVAPENGWWWNPSESGSGYAIERQGNSIFMAAFLYETSGAATWYATVLALQPDGTYKGDMTRYVGGKSLLGTYKAPNSTLVVATATLTFPDPFSGVMKISFLNGAPARSVPITRFAFGSPAFEPSNGTFQNSWWWNDQESGTGYFLEVQGSNAFIASFMYDTAGQPTWYASLSNLTGNNLLSGALDTYTNGQSIAGAYKAPMANAGAAGSMSYSFASNSVGSMTLPNAAKVAIKRFMFDSTASTNRVPVPSAGNNQTVSAGDTVYLNGSGTDADRDPLTFYWRLLSAPNGSKATLADVQSTRPYFVADTAGSYRVLLLTDDGKSSNGQSVVTVTANPKAVTNTPPVANAGSNQTVSVGSTVKLSGAASSDANGDVLTYAWFFVTKPVGSNALLAGATSVSPSFIADVAGSYVVGLNVNDGKVSSPQSTLTITVNAIAQSVIVDCAGTYCASTGVTSYSGSGIGVWQYVNSTTKDAKVDINIAGVSAGKTATLLFSNGSNSTTTNSPSAGTLSEPSQFISFEQTMAANVENDEFEKLMKTHDHAHNRQLQQNEKLDKERLKPLRSDSQRFEPTIFPLSYAPSLNSKRQWIDYYGGGTGTPYTTTLKATCSIPSGRNVNVWVDDNSLANNQVTDNNVGNITSTYCGPNGSAAKLNALLGDFWGSDTYANDISDSPLQDINIVIINNPSSSGWAGYFNSGNNILKSSTFTNTNEALVFFISASNLKSNSVYILSTLIHESTHMINSYQMKIKSKGVKGHDTWLEETSAMMSEDIIAPTVIFNADGSPYNKITTYRIPTYIKSGGGISYINWTNLDDYHYDAGAAYGAFLSRKYGLSVYKNILNCTKPSYNCMDNLIKTLGGSGFADEFSRMGASVFSLMPGNTSPMNYGFPAKNDAGYNLFSADLSVYAATRPANPAALTSGFTATTHTYQTDTIPPGKTNYIRSGVVVPANTSLILTIR